jgi:hypothetical protein
MPRLVHPTVLGDRESTLTLIGGHYWHRGPNPELHLPNDGRVLPEWIEFRRIYDSATKPDTRFPTRAKLHLHYPAAAVGRVHLNRVANDGGSLRVLVDGDPVVLRKWPAATAAAPAVTDQTYAFQIGYGSHVIEIENPFGPNWIDLQSFDTGIPVPALVAVARQGRDRMALWVHHRDNLLSAASDEELSPATGTVQMPDVPAGRWTVTWWDPAAGTTIGSSTLRHEGGTLSLETPPILRHAAAWLQPAEE